MYLHYVVLFLCINLVRNEDCFTYNFEDNFEEVLSTTYGLCADDVYQNFWSLGEYSTELTPPHNLSTRYMYLEPSGQSSCISISETVSAGGTLRIKILSELQSLDDTVNILVMGDDGGNQGHINIEVLTYPWQTEEVLILSDSENLLIHIYFIGAIHEGSYFYVDSLQYIPEGQDIEACEIYSQVPPEEPEPEVNPEEPEPEVNPEEPEPEVNPEEPEPEVNTEEPEPDVNPEEPEPEVNPEEPEPEVNPEEPEPEVNPEEPEPEVNPEEPEPEVNPEEPEPEVNPEEPEPEVNTEEPEPEVNTEEPEPEVNPEEPGTDSGEDDIEVVIVTEKGFWNAATITMVVVLSIVFVATVSYLFYEIGKKKAKNSSPPSMSFLDMESQTKTTSLPRVHKVYTDGSSINGM